MSLQENHELIFYYGFQFEKPGKTSGDYPDWAQEAGTTNPVMHCNVIYLLLTFHSIHYFIQVAHAQFSAVFIYFIPKQKSDC